ncbi:FecR family protein [Pedobacter sp. Leaf250]|uniref:FecR family protein n=1 Tax=Pedobacter sp. Leaf250 TaxID=2876559 RepID=UPI001E629693|nr:FecR domain-containing protein [Pedobacter sp. Leaf250]
MLNQPEYLDLIVRYLNNPQDEKLHSDIVSFCAESKSNASYFKDVERIWNLSSQSGRLNHLNEKEAVANFHQALKKASSRSTNLIKWLSGVAATILLAGSLYWLLELRNTVEIISLKTTSSIDSVRLADGSAVVLANHTVVKYPKVFKGSSREIFLSKGKAFFKVTKDPQHPFQIIMGESKVSVLGTSFNIDYSPSKIDLDVKTGKVIFSPYSNGASSILTAGQALTYNIQKREFTTRLSQNADSWLTKELVFVDTPLGEVCKQLSHYYSKNIKLEANHQFVEKFNAKFEKNSLNEVLEVLKATYNLKLRETKDNIILTTP